MRRDWVRSAEQGRDLHRFATTHGVALERRWINWPGPMLIGNAFPPPRFEA